MTELSPTCIGRVRHVLGTVVTVGLDPQLASTSPTWAGELISVGQIGSLVRIPQGPISLLGSVLLVGIADELSESDDAAVAEGQRWMKVELLGELTSSSDFERGVSSYPSLDDEVHFVSSTEIRSVFPAADKRFVDIGALSSSGGTRVTVDLEKLVARHSVVVGSTGAGKSSATASILQGIVGDERPGAKILVFDAHGEYAKAFPGESKYQALEQGHLRVPLWLLPADEILEVLTGSSDSALTASKFREVVVGLRRKFADAAEWLTLPPSDISPDTPIPFDVREAWFQLDVANKGVYASMQGAGGEVHQAPGDAASLTPTLFANYGAGNTAPYRGPEFDRYGTIPERMRQSLLDPRMAFLLDDLSKYSDKDPLPEIVLEWLSDKPISIISLDGLPQEAAEIALGAVLRVCYDLGVWSAPGSFGHERPLLIVVEEAHRFIGDQSGGASYARNFVNRVAREGRKYGIGLMLISQRPSELPRTALSQVGTFIALRLNNAADQSAIRSALPDGSASLADALASLRTGEALVVGEGVRLPSRILVTPPSPWPSGTDANVGGWAQGQPIMLDATVDAWRSRKRASDD